MLRKDFLRASAGIVFGGIPLLQMACGSAAERREGEKHTLPAIGVQLYTVRDLLQDDFEGTIEKVAQLGYDELEFAGYYNRTPNQVSHLLKRLDLKAPATHMSIDLLRNSLNQMVETAVTIGHKYIVCPWLPEEERTGDHYKAHAEFFNKVGEACHGAGLRFAYHNHAFEFEPVDGGAAYDILLNETDPALVDMELDLFWIIKGGHQPQEYFARYPGRFALCHVKDMTAGGDMTSVGSGEIDFKKIFAQAGKAGLKHYFVEHDKPEDSMASIKLSIDHLKQLEFG
jgi:sugar phosphate isomerase/epimerase